MASGIVIIDKPSGWTSMDVCAKIRGILKKEHLRKKMLKYLVPKA